LNFGEIVPITGSSGTDRKNREILIASGQIPRHIAIIMDGNGRWAKRKGLPRIAGHNEGVNSVRDIIEACGQIGVKYVTLYTFSTENWKRPEEEVSLLMRLLLKALRDERDRLHQNEVRLRVIGDMNTLPPDVADEMRSAVQMMDNNKGLTLVLALSYSGRWDITNAVKQIYEDISGGLIDKNQISEDLIGNYLSTKDIPEPDLLIRTSGEFRISNFLIWQIAYTEMYVSNEYWPAFRRKQLYAAIEDYQKRERRFGMVAEQIQPAKKSRGLWFLERSKQSVK
jgi:undecaprenyl diphosphate synthase